MLIRLTGNKSPLIPRLEVSLFKVALRLLTNCFQFSLPKRTLKTGCKLGYLYCLCFCCFHEVGEGGRRSKGAFQVLVAQLLRYLASGEEEVGGCWGEVPLNAGCVVNGLAFEVPGTSPFHYIKEIPFVFSLTLSSALEPES